MSQDEVVAVRLRRTTTSTPWGFRMQGGNEYGTKLFIQKVNPKSLSYRQGLRLNDRILAIGNVEAHGMSHEQAKMEIIRAGNEVDLIVQRVPGQGQDQPDSRPVRRVPEQSQMVEESTEYRGYTNPNVQSRSFKILQDSLSYSDMNEEGMMAPSGHTPGEGVVKRAYNEGRRRLEELMEINPRNFTADGQSPYRYNIAPTQDDDETRLAGEQAVVTQQYEPVHSSQKTGAQVSRQTPAPAKVHVQSNAPINIAASSVLSPAGTQQEYLAQAHQYYQGKQPEKPLKLMNYQFDQQYGHLNQGSAQVQQQSQPQTVQQQSQSSDFIPATKTVSSVAEDLDLKHVTSANQDQSVAVSAPVPQQQQEQQPRRRRQRVRPTRPEGQTEPSPVPTQAPQAATVCLDASDGLIASKPAETKVVLNTQAAVKPAQPETAKAVVMETEQKQKTTTEQTVVEVAQPAPKADETVPKAVEEPVAEAVSATVPETDTVKTIEVPKAVEEPVPEAVSETVPQTDTVKTIEDSVTESAAQPEQTEPTSGDSVPAEVTPETSSATAPAPDATAEEKSVEEHVESETPSEVVKEQSIAAEPEPEQSIAAEEKAPSESSEQKEKSSETVEIEMADVSESVTVETTKSETGDQVKSEEAITSESSVDTVVEVETGSSETVEIVEIQTTKEADVATPELGEISGDQAESEVTLSVSADVDSSTTLMVSEEAEINIDVSNEADTATVLQIDAPVEDGDQTSVDVGESVTLSVSEDVTIDTESEVVIENVEFSADTSTDVNVDSAAEVTFSMDVEETVNDTTTQADKQANTATTKVDEKRSEGKKDDILSKPAKKVGKLNLEERTPQGKSASRSAKFVDSQGGVLGRLARLQKK